MNDSGSNYELNRRWRSVNEILDAADGDLRLDLGCGYYKPAGYIGLDNLIGARTQHTNEANAPDIFIDLNTEPLPFEERSCSEVRASHFLEHAILDHVIDEVSRVLVDGGVFTIIVPYANSAEGMYPGHGIFLTRSGFEIIRTSATTLRSLKSDTERARST